LFGMPDLLDAFAVLNAPSYQNMTWSQQASLLSTFTKQLLLLEGILVKTAEVVTRLENEAEDWKELWAVLKNRPSKSNWNNLFPSVSARLDSPLLRDKLSTWQELVEAVNAVPEGLAWSILAKQALADVNRFMDGIQ